jgi:hypothetical protein
MYHTNRTRQQVGLTWVIACLVRAAGCWCAVQLLHGITYERAGMVVGCVTALIAYRYLFPYLSFAQALFSYFMVDTSMTVLVLCSRVTSMIFVRLLRMWADTAFLLLYMPALTAFVVVFHEKTRWVVLKALAAFRGHMGLLASFAAAGYCSILLQVDPWDRWGPIELQQGIYWMLLSAFIILGYVVAVRALVVIRERDAAENQARALGNQVALSERYYDSIIKQTEATRAYHHDLRFHVGTLSGLCAKGDVEEIRRYVNEMSNELPDPVPGQYCAVGAVNALMEHYASLCKQQRTELRCQLCIPADTKIQPLHLCLIFGNAMQNALEAVQDKDERWIAVQAVYKYGRLAIRMANPCPDKPDMDHGCPSTKNGDGHGLGLENIRAAVERYSGWFGVAWDNGIFTISADLKDE